MATSAQPVSSTTSAVATGEAQPRLRRINWGMTGRIAGVVIVTFIAMLELAKETLIEVTQAEAYAPIYVRLAYQPA